MKSSNDLAHLSRLSMQKIPVDVHRWVIEMHEAVRQGLERHFEGKWRVKRIQESSSTDYGITRATRTAPNPEYILGLAMVTFDVYLVENGPVEKIMFGQLVTIPKQELYCNVKMLDDGTLIIVETKISLPPSKRGKR